MFLRYVCCALALLASTLGSALGAQGPSAFSYDPVHPFGPGNWDHVLVSRGGENHCAGRENSPVAIEDMECSEFADYIMETGDCTKGDMAFTVNDHVVVATFTADCTRPSLEIPGVEGVFDALQFHIHMGSEHTVDGVTFGAEMHIVHLMQDCPEGTKRCYAVVGTKLNPASAENSDLFSFFLEGWIDVHNAEEARCNTTGNDIEYEPITTNETLIDPYQFNRGDRFFHYAGGLTTPPCSEVVWWNLDDEALPISVDQYIALGRIILDYKDADCNPATVAHHGSSSRPTRPLYGRPVKKICPQGSPAAEGRSIGGS